MSVVILLKHHKQTLASMSTREMFSLWWKEPWIRYLVLALSPIGFIDAVYTVLLWNMLGLQYETNPLVRIALTSEWWYVWFLADVFSFTIFAMIAGSYYLHTRSKIFGNKIWWFSGLIAFRVAAASYNTLVFYGVSLTIELAILIGFFTFWIVGKLLSRTDELTIDTIKTYFRLRKSYLYEMYLKSTIPSPKSQYRKDVPSPSSQVKPDLEYSWKMIWLKRAGYMSMVVLVFVSTPFILIMIAEVTGAASWSNTFGSLVFWNSISAHAFVMGFAVILLLTALMMYFILRAFSSNEGVW